MIQIFESNTDEYAYVPLLKNAHLWGEMVFEKYLKFEKVNYEFDKDKKYIIFLRDPIDRWLSGIGEYLQIVKTDNKLNYQLHSNYKLDPLHLHMLFTVIGFDPHTQGQFRYIRQYNPRLERGKCIYFYLNDPKFAEKVAYFVYKHFQVIIPTQKIHTIEESIFKQNIRKQLEATMKHNPTYNSNLQKYFQEDYDFIKNCAFYNPNSSSI